MAMVTSPSFKSWPCWMVSTFGPLSATQRLCSGLVKTPMLALVTVSVLVVSVVDTSVFSWVLVVSSVG